VLIEIQERQRLIVHHDVAISVDHLLRGRTVETELRYRDEQGAIHRAANQPAPPPTRGKKDRGREMPLERGRAAESVYQREEIVEEESTVSDLAMMPPGTPRGSLKPVKAYSYGIARNRLEEGAGRLRVPLTVVSDLDEADLVVTVKNYYRKRPKMIGDAEKHGTPIYVLRASTDMQIDSFLTDVFGLTGEETDPYSLAMHDVQDAIQRVQTGVRTVDLTPQPAHIRRMQHEMIREAQLISHSYGREPYRRVRIYRE
jgi:hypothetical protein